MSIIYKVNCCSHILAIIPSVLFSVDGILLQILSTTKACGALIAVSEESPSYGSLSQFGLYGII